MLTIEVPSAAEAWLEAWTAINAKGSPRTSGSKGGSTEVIHAAFTLTDPRRRWTWNRQPAMNPVFALAEVVWMVRGRDDAAFLTPWNSVLPRYVGEGPHLHGAYGHRLREMVSFDQLERAADALLASPQSRQVVLQIWDAERDMPDAAGRTQSADIPCNVISLLKVSQGELHWMQVMRSNDLIRGLPYNFIQWTTLQEILAGWIGLEVGRYTHVVDSLHIYDHDVTEFSAATEDPPPARKSVDLRVDRERSSAVFRELETAFERLAAAISPGDIEMALQREHNLGAYDDWIRAAAAERYSRLRQRSQSQSTMLQIRDAHLRHAMLHWFERKRSVS